jgi:hypothetical protein
MPEIVTLGLLVPWMASMTVWLRILVAVAIGAAGALATYLLTDKIGGIAEPILGPTFGTILAGIIAVGGLVITAAIVVSVVRPNTRTSIR